MADHFAPLRTSNVALLTSYKRDGSEVGTPVGVGVVDGTVYFTTRAKSWKAKRIARDPHVTLAPCTKRGAVLGATVDGIAHRIPRAPYRTTFRYRFFTALYLLVYRDRPLDYQVTPPDPAPGDHRG